MALDLKGRQVEAFRNALLNAFPEMRDLKALVEIELHESLEHIVESGPARGMAFDLVLWARKQSLLDELLAGALRQNPDNQALRALSYELSMSSDRAPSRDLEALVMPSVAFENAAQWRMRMACVERCICRIEQADGAGGWRGVGTGSLVGNDIVLTNHHVVAALDGRVARAQFDYALDADGVERRGPAIALMPTALASSSPQQLDFALLRLTRTIGDQSDAAGQRRGWLTPCAHTFTAGEPIFILQHPRADRLKLGVGVISDIQFSPPRLRYTANTAPGSSGSPCFTLGWKLVALHHAGETATNRGIPLSAIVEKLRDDGFRNLLGHDADACAPQVGAVTAAASFAPGMAAPSIDATERVAPSMPGRIAPPPLKQAPLDRASQRPLSKPDSPGQPPEEGSPPSPPYPRAPPPIPGAGIRLRRAIVLVATIAVLLLVLILIVHSQSGDEDSHGNDTQVADSRTPGPAHDAIPDGILGAGVQIVDARSVPRDAKRDARKFDAAIDAPTDAATDAATDAPIDAPDRVTLTIRHQPNCAAGGGGTVTSDPPGINCAFPSQCSARFDVGTKIVLSSNVSNVQNHYWHLNGDSSRNVCCPAHRCLTCPPISMDKDSVMSYCASTD